MPVVHRPRLAGAGAIAAIAVLTLAGPVSAEQRSVSMVDDEFVPSSITIAVGDGVRWTNDGERPHTVTSLSGPAFDSGIVMPGGDYARTFTSAGTFAYHCFLHDGMEGRVVVRAAATARPTDQPRPTARPTGGSGGNGGEQPPPDTATVAGVTGDTGSGSDGGLLVAIGAAALGALAVGRRRLMNARAGRASRPWG
jgi:plastocyanin